MKALLYSLNLTPDLAQALARLTGRRSDGTRVAAIENAADVVTEGPPGWVEAIRGGLVDLGYNVQPVDLRDYRASDTTELDAELAQADVIWVGGGNTAYLRWITQRSGAHDLIRAHVIAGTVYAGWSAGAILAGPTLRHIEKVEDISVVPGEIPEDGLAFYNCVIIPHFDNPDFAAANQAWGGALAADEFPIQPLNDQQAVLLQDSGAHVIG